MQTSNKQLTTKAFKKNIKKNIPFKVPLVRGGSSNFSAVASAAGPQIDGYYSRGGGPPLHGKNKK